MKTKYLLPVLLSIWIPALAQNGLEFGIGPVFSNITLKGIDNSIRPDRALHTGLQIQALWNQHIGEGFSVAAGLAYKEKGFVWNEGLSTNVLNIPINIGVTAKTNINYIELPLNLKYSIGNEKGIIAFAFAGPSVGYALNATLQTSANTIFDFNISRTKINLNDAIYNRMELGANAGGGIEIPVGNGSIMASAQYMHGFNRVIDNTVIDFKARNYGFGLNLGYKINF
jgi:hypothetical protein